VLSDADNYELSVTTLFSEVLTWNVECRVWDKATYKHNCI